MATNIHTVGTPPDGLSEERRQGNMVRMQMEALSRSHRERITTNDTRERKAEFVPLGLIQRRVYQEGTEENSAAQGKARTQLAAWSTAWKNLQDDDTETRSLKEINEGLGQTHRGKLQADGSLGIHTLEEDNRFSRGISGSHRASRGQGGGRDGGFASRYDGRTKRSKPIKRARVVKGSTSPSQANSSLLVKPNEISSMRTASSTSSMRKVSGNGNVSRARASTPIHRPAAKSKEALSREFGRSNNIYTGQLATPNEFMASIHRSFQPQVPVDLKSPLHTEEASSITTTHVKGTSNETSDILDKSEDKVASTRSSSPQTDLMDLDVEQEVPQQPVIGFTHPPNDVTETSVSRAPLNTMDTTVQESSALAKITPFIHNIEVARAADLLNETQLATLESIVHELQTRADNQATNTGEISISGKPTKAGSYSRADLLALRPKTACSIPKAVVDPTKICKVEKENTKMKPRTSTPPSIENGPNQSVPDEVEAQRELIVGEHVHRTRFQRADSNEKSGDSYLAGSASLPSHQGPSPPAHLASLRSIKDHGAAAHAQYGVGNALPSSKPSELSSLKGPSLPAHLANRGLVRDQGAAVRAQYSS